MRSSRPGVPAFLVVATLSALLAGCGGFGTKEPSTLDTAVTRYVALGDGFAAAPYAGRTTSRDGCLRSADNYPRLVAKALGVTDFRDVSCVAATTTAITRSFRPPGATRAVPPQLAAVGKDTELVTLTVGIMDGHLLTGMFDLCAVEPCGTRVLVKDVAERLQAISTALPRVIRQVSEKAPGAYVVVVGYPELLPFKRDCTALPPMDDAQWGYTNQAWEQFSAAVGSSARQAGAAYVDVRQLSEEHAPCSKDPWVTNHSTVKGQRLAYHPRAAEQKAVADAVAAQVRTR